MSRKQLVVLLLLVSNVNNVKQKILPSFTLNITHFRLVKTLKQATQ